MHEPGARAAGDHRPAADGGGPVTERSESPSDGVPNAVDSAARRRVTAPPGFRPPAHRRAEPSGNPDVALVVNDGPAHAAAGVFTRNKVKAAPVLWSRSRCSPTGRLRAVVLNSGGANACTGPQGFQTTHATAEKAAELLGLRSAVEVAVCSTGLIGEQLPRDVLLAGVEAAAKALGDDAASGRAAATGDHDHRHRRQGGRARRRRGLEHRRHHQGRRHDRARRWPRCSPCSPPTPWSTRPCSTRRCAPRCRLTFDRLDVDGSMSTNDTVLRPGLAAPRACAADPAGFTAALTAVCARPRAADAGRRRGRHQARHRARHAAPPPRTRPSSSPAPSPRQPGQDRDVRRRPELGPDRRRRRVRRRRAAIPNGSTSRSTACCCAGAAWPRATAPPPTCPARTSSSRSTLRPRRRGRGDPHHGPVARLRGGEQCLLHLSRAP